MFKFALLYLAIPVFIFCFSFLSIPFVISSAVALVILIFCLCRLKQSNVDIHLNIRGVIKYWPLFLFSLLITYIVVVYPFGTHDWTNYFAAFNLLAESAWVPLYELDGETWFLRYYLAWFIPPALFTKIFGIQFLTPVLFIWTAAGLCIAMLLAFHNLNKTFHLFVAPLVLFLFSGLDLVGAWLVDFLIAPGPYWLDWWAGQQVFAVLSNLNTFHHSPHHALAAFLPSSLFLFDRRYAVQYGALIITIIAMWSTFCAIGLLPIAVWAVHKEGLKTALTAQNLLVAPLLAIPIVLYLTQGAGQVPHMFTWEHDNFTFYNFFLFLLLEFLLVLAIFYWLCKEERSLIIALAVFLVILSIYKFGEWNNLIYRGSIPSVFVMSIIMLNSLLKHKGWSREFLIVYMIIGAIPVLVISAKRVSLPLADRNSSFQEHYDERPAEFRDNERWQYLVKIGHAVRVFNTPLIRGLPEINPRACANH